MSLLLLEILLIIGGIIFIYFIFKGMLDKILGPIKGIFSSIGSVFSGDFIPSLPSIDTPSIGLDIRSKNTFNRRNENKK